MGTLGMRGEGVTNSSVLLVLDHCVKGFGDKGPERCLKGYNKVREKGWNTLQHTSAPFLLKLCPSPTPSIRLSSQVLFLIRNPFDALVAERKRVVNMIRATGEAGADRTQYFTPACGTPPPAGPGDDLQRARRAVYSYFRDARFPQCSLSIKMETCWGVPW